MDERKLLIADDSELNRAILVSVLEKNFDILEAADGKVVCKRLLATEVETVEVPLPAVIAVSPDVAQPRIAGMKQILAAGKKPQTVEAADAPAAAAVETVAVKAPEQADRASKVFEDVNEFVAAVKAAL